MDFMGKNSAEIYAKNGTKYPPHFAKGVIKKLEELNPEMEENGKFELFVDAGCGAGSAATHFLPYFKAMIGFDISEEQIKMAQSARPPDMKETMSYYVATESEMPAKDNSVDLIICKSAIHYMNVDKFVRECKRVLKNHGLAALFAAYYSEMVIEQVVDNKIVSSTSGFPLLKEIILNPLVNHLKNTGHPSYEAWDLRYERICQKITGINKEKPQDVFFDVYFNFDDFEEYMNRTPIFRQHFSNYESHEQPFVRLKKEFKALIGAPNAEDKSLSLKLTVSVFTIYLTK
uniref:uncharacterized protein LOC120341355 n=1 Tax=Styela clava TaxID=7725 RepID=UPI00193A02C9|nr:uncharacterized protein LOC120341355 [Styela clava]